MRSQRTEARERKPGNGSQGTKMRLFFCIPFSVFCLLSFPVFAQGDKDEKNFVYQVDSQRDPMVPLVTTKGLIRNLHPVETKRGLKLEGIIYDKRRGQSLAVIDGEILNVGDNLGDIKVLEIREDAVVVLKKGDIVEMSLETEEE